MGQIDEWPQRKYYLNILVEKGPFFNTGCAHVDRWGGMWNPVAGPEGRGECKL